MGKVDGNEKNTPKDFNSLKHRFRIYIFCKSEFLKILLSNIDILLQFYFNKPEFLLHKLFSKYRFKITDCFLMGQFDDNLCYILLLAPTKPIER